MTESTSSTAPTSRDVSRPFVQLGVTGGIAAGKSTVLAMLAKRGARTIDTDEIAHAVLAKGTDTSRAVEEAFGKDVVDKDGSINRARLGEVVFGDENKRLLLNSLMHPAIRRQWLAQVDNLEKQGFHGVVAVGIPLLYEVGVQNQFDAVLVVACTRETQVQRLLERGLTQKQACRRIDAQMPLSEKMERANYVIWNESPLAVLEEQVSRVWERLLKRLLNARTTVQ